MKGCVLYGRYVFFDSDEKNARLRQKRLKALEQAAPQEAEDDGQQ